jgi:hypothetical protein
MSHYVGSINCSYAALVVAFGPSQCWDNRKSDAEWEIDIPGVGVAYVYNYKDGRNYLGDDGLDVENIRDWHIGGDTDAVVRPVRDMVAAAVETDPAAADAEFLARRGGVW